MVDFKEKLKEDVNNILNEASGWTTPWTFKNTFKNINANPKVQAQTDANRREAAIAQLERQVPDFMDIIKTLNDSRFFQKFEYNDPIAEAFFEKVGLLKYECAALVRAVNYVLDECNAQAPKYLQKK